MLVLVTTPDSGPDDKGIFHAQRRSPCNSSLNCRLNSSFHCSNCRSISRETRCCARSSPSVQHANGMAECSSRTVVIQLHHQDHTQTYPYPTQNTRQVWVLSRRRNLRNGKCTYIWTTRSDMAELHIVCHRPLVCDETSSLTYGSLRVF